MSLIKSFSVGNGDMFYIYHDTDNFSIIDCYLSDDNEDEILEEIKDKYDNKEITRFISTHPDEDHILGLEKLDDEINIINFYCVQNEATKEDETECFNRYCELRDSDKAFYIKYDCSRRWMNLSTEGGRGSSGINILWPKTHVSHFKEELEKVKEGKSPNNISPIIKYSLKDGVTALWMGDLENDFMEKIKDDLDLEEVDLLFAPHHGRKSGRVPSELLDVLNPKLIIVGEASSEDLEYYNKYNTLTQNSAGNILFDCLMTNEVNIYVSNDNYVDNFSLDFLDDENISDYNDYNEILNYIGTLKLVD